MFIYVSTSVAVPCGDPPTIPNGSRTFTGTTFGDTATYTCNPGYQRSGSATVICQASESWSTRPTCPLRTIRKLYNNSLYYTLNRRWPDFMYMCLHL